MWRRAHMQVQVAPIGVTFLRVGSFAYGPSFIVHRRYRLCTPAPWESRTLFFLSISLLIFRLSSLPSPPFLFLPPPTSPCVLFLTGQVDARGIWPPSPKRGHRPISFRRLSTSPLFACSGSIPPVVDVFTFRFGLPFADPVFGFSPFLFGLYSPRCFTSPWCYPSLRLGPRVKARCQRS